MVVGTVPDTGFVTGWGVGADVESKGVWIPVERGVTIQAGIQFLVLLHDESLFE